MITLRVTTNPGIEDVAGREIDARLAAAGIEISDATVKGFDLPGVVTAAIPAMDPVSPGDRDRLWDALRPLRSVYHVAVHVAEARWDGDALDDLVSAVSRLDLDALVDADSFRVSCSRSGNHDFHSPDVEREVGGGLQEKYGTAVNLENPRVNVRIDIVGRRALCGYQLTGKKGLDRRYPWRYHPRVTLRTPVAYAMLVLSGFEATPGSLHDPFCGSGTILLEAAGVVRERAVRESGVESGAGDRGLRISGSDWDESAVAGATANIEAAWPGEFIPVFHGDARDLSSRIAAGSLRYIVTNPPFGIRLGKEANFTGLYDAILREAALTLESGGTLALLVGKRRAAFNRALRQHPEFTLEHVRVIEIGGVYPGIFVVRRAQESHRGV